MRRHSLNWTHQRTSSHATEEGSPWHVRFSRLFPGEHAAAFWTPKFVSLRLMQWLDLHHFVSCKPALLLHVFGRLVFCVFCNFYYATARLLFVFRLFDYWMFVLSCIVTQIRLSVVQERLLTYLLTYITFLALSDLYTIHTPRRLQNTHCSATRVVLVDLLTTTQGPQESYMDHSWKPVLCCSLVGNTTVAFLSATS